MTDTRIPYGVNCTWWDSIDKVALTPPGQSGIRIPCCPFCGSVLYEVDSEEIWFDGAQRYENNGHPGYVEFLKWMRGKCFPTVKVAAAFYNALEGSYEV